MSYREAVCNLLRIIDRKAGSGLDVEDQVAIAEAKTLIAIQHANYFVTTVVCNTMLCPSRLELHGDLGSHEAATKAAAMKWWTDGVCHVCPTCKER